MDKNISSRLIMIVDALKKKCKYYYISVLISSSLLFSKFINLIVHL